MKSHGGREHLTLPAEFLARESTLENFLLSEAIRENRSPAKTLVASSVALSVTSLSLVFFLNKKLSLLIGMFGLFDGSDFKQGSRAESRKVLLCIVRSSDLWLLTWRGRGGTILVYGLANQKINR